MCYCCNWTSTQSCREIICMVEAAKPFLPLSGRMFGICISFSINSNLKLHKTERFSSLIIWLFVFLFYKGTPDAFERVLWQLAPWLFIQAWYSFYTNGMLFLSAFIASRGRWIMECSELKSTVICVWKLVNHTYYSAQSCAILQHFLCLCHFCFPNPVSYERYWIGTAQAEPTWAAMEGPPLSHLCQTVWCYCDNETTDCLLPSRGVSWKPYEVMHIIAACYEVKTVCFRKKHDLRNRNMKSSTPSRNSVE